MYIEIVTDTFDWNPEGTKTTFKLRIVDDATEKKFRRESQPKAKWVRGRQVDNFDQHAFVNKCLDYAIVEWSGVRHKGVEFPCTTANKLFLPETVKTEIIRLCLGKQAGELVAGDSDEDESAEAPADPKKS